MIVRGNDGASPIPILFDLILVIVAIPDAEILLNVDIPALAFALPFTFPVKLPVTLPDKFALTVPDIMRLFPTLNEH